MQTSPSPTWVLASNNSGKLKEFARLLAAARIHANLVNQAALHIDNAIEDGLSFVENAIIKARHASAHSGLPALADDSGLCVPLLDGAPGIYSARYAGTHGDDAANNQKLLADLQPFRSKDHTPIAAQFVCVLAWVRHANDPLPLIAQGVWHGQVLEAPAGEHGFGYDPLFYLPDLHQSAAELSDTQKNQHSHRARAMAVLLPQLTQVHRIAN